MPRMVLGFIGWKTCDDTLPVGSRGPGPAASGSGADHRRAPATTAAPSQWHSSCRLL
jgi:hypothetical protein